MKTKREFITELKVAYPDVFHFETEMEVRVGDLNYGGHLGNIELQYLLHEARVRTFGHFGYTESKFGDGKLLLSEVWVKQIAELIHGDRLTIRVAVVNLSKVRFDLFYAVRKTGEDQDVAAALTTMALVSDEGRPIRLPAGFKF